MGDDDKRGDNRGIVYRIPKWKKHFESKASQKYKHKSQCYLPLKQGLGMKLILAHENGPAMFGCFVLMAQMCSRHEPDRDGWLTVDGQSTSRAYQAIDIAVQIFVPLRIVDETLRVLTNPNVGWIEVYDSNLAPIDCQSIDSRAVVDLPLPLPLPLPSPSPSPSPSGEEAPETGGVSDDDQYSEAPYFKHYTRLRDSGCKFVSYPAFRICIRGDESILDQTIDDLCAISANELYGIKNAHTWMKTRMRIARDRGDVGGEISVKINAGPQTQGDIEQAYALDEITEAQRDRIMAGKMTLAEARGESA